MKKTFIKVVLRDLKRNLSRFIAIMAIVALGVGFLIGLLSATPDLRYSLDKYYDEQNAYDILIKSSIGFSNADVESLKNDLTNEIDVEGVSSIDYDCIYQEQDKSVRLIIQDFNDKINKLELLSGRYPASDKECIVFNNRLLFNVDCIGEKILVNEDEYEIVGIVNSPVYYYKLLEPSTVGNGNLDIVAYLNSNYFDDYTITDINITIDNVKKLDCFNDKYFDYLKPTENYLKNLSSNYLSRRLELLKDEAYAKGIEEARSSQEYLDMLEQIKTNITNQFPAGTEEEVITNAINSYIAILDKELEEKVIEEVDNEFLDIDAEWYILNRKSNASYVSVKENSVKIDNIAVVFPVFFFFIAALIALTSVTRMITEERSSIGTLKSLGYSNFTILMKYLFYAFISCLIGSLAGVVTGVYLLPIVIYNCFNMLFVMPQGYFPWQSSIIIFSVVSISLTIFIVMIILCLKTLSEKPNALMVPKAPRAGKKILLERIGFIWKHLKFKHKSSIRNVVRFKKNLIMMIVGVGGCTALMLVAFGLNDSMRFFSEGQYDNVLNYDISLSLEEEIELPMLTDSEKMYLYKEDAKVLDNEEYELNIYYTDITISNYINIDAKEFNEDTVIVSRQLAEKFNLKKGSEFSVSVDGGVKKFKVSNIFDNYIENYLIVHKNTIDNNKINTCLIKLGEADLINRESIIIDLYDLFNIEMIEDLSQTRITYDSMSESIGYVVYLVVFMCGALAVIVIFNLTNININERVKEIATLRVLGYQKNEVRWYIYREILMMSFLAIIFGLILGPILNSFVMDKISSPGQYFSSSLLWPNYIYTIITTIVFIILVFCLFIKRFEKIKMVESLKSVE